RSPAIRPRPRTTTTSRASTRRSGRRSSAGWTRWRVAVACRCSAEAHVQAHDAAVHEAAHLHQVAEVVGQPEAVAALPVAGRPLPAGERVVEPAAVGDLAVERLVVVPDEHAPPPA